jgi:hypothetical protein
VRREVGGVKRLAILIVGLVVASAVQSVAQQMPDPRAMSGVPLPDNTLPPGTVSVRVVRGSMSNNLSGRAVEFSIDGTRRTITTDETGRAQVSGLKPGARVKAVAVIDGERLETQEVTIGQGAWRFVLAASDPDAAKKEAEDRARAAAPPVPGMVVFGSESRIIVQFGQDRLEIFYALDIVNTARTPVDIGGPVIVELPREARGTTVLEDSSPKATANGPRVTVTGPFPPGATPVHIAYEMPHRGPTVRIEQRWPAALPQLSVMLVQSGGLDITSPQFAGKRETAQDGQALVLASGPGLAAGQSLTFEITGLPYHSRWPRHIALTLVVAIMAIGIWAAIFPPRKTA